MPLPPSSDHRISLPDARDLTRRHREGAHDPAERGGLFHAKAVRELLAQQGCAGLRFYHGRNADGTPAMVFVGVDANGNDMTAGTVLELHWPCPPYCSEPDTL